MPLVVGDKKIEKVEIVDDNPKAREAMAWHIVDAKLEAIKAPGPLGRLPAFVSLSLKSADAAVCDHKLGLIGKYAEFDGAQAVAELYSRGFPAVLCTNFAKSDIDTIRLYRRKIPSLIRTDDVDPDGLVEGFVKCVKEIKGDFVPSRKPWRTLIRVEELLEDVKPLTLNVVLPGWSSNERVRIPLDIFPSQFRQQIMADTRFHAMVNLGAEDPNELFFDEFEF